MKEIIKDGKIKYPTLMIIFLVMYELINNLSIYVSLVIVIKFPI